MTVRPLLAAPMLLLAACSGGVTPTSTGGGVVAEAAPGAPAGLDYAQDRAVYRAGRAIAPNTASVIGTGITFSVQPALPSGLALDPATGTIAGTPAAVAATTLHVVTATNANGSTTAGVSITVLSFENELEPAQFGNAASVRLLGAVWGRLVDVYDEDANGLSRLVTRDLLVRADATGAATYVLATNVATQGERITIRAPLGTPAFADAYDQLQANLPELPVAAPGDLPPYPMVPRNSAIALRFDDLIDPATIAPESVRAGTGVPELALQSLRLRGDPNHGNVSDRDGDGRLEYWPTRVLLDPAVSAVEALDDAHAIAADPDGYPASQSASESNVVLRIPTVAAGGAILRNLAGNALASSGNGPVDPGSPGLDVVRALRSGGPSDATGDPYEGFLRDDVRPQVVAEIPVTVANVAPDPQATAEDRVVDVRFASAGCAAALRRGDTLQVGRAVLEVRAASAPPVGADVSGVRVKVMRRTNALGGSARLHTRLDLVLDQARLGCFLAFDPPATAAPAAGVAPEARVILRADEPLAARSLSAMDETRIARGAGALGAREIVPAAADVPADLRGVALRPLVPLTHASGASEAYFVRVAGWSDLAGNVLQSTLSSVPFALDAGAASVASGGVTFRFDSADMLPGAGAPPDAGTNHPEFRGQFLYDFARGVAASRPVSRFQAAADRSQAVPSLMIPFTPGLRTPLNRYGAKVQNLWRYCDVGFGLLDEQFHNVDVEHLYWAPTGGSAVADAVQRFEIGLAHSGRLPDESLDANLLPRYPNSGLFATYAQNLADPVADPLRTVHPGANGTPGYVVQPSDASTTASGTVVMPWPMNQGLPVDQWTRYTWRDTALTATGGANGPGAELAITGGPIGVPYAPGQVPSIGLPLLMEFRCYPGDATLGLNAFDVSLMVASSARPTARAFSAGGINTSGQVVIRDPDLETVASGGFNPNSLPSPGAPTLPTDNVFAIGAMDLVIRVSRMHSIWIDSSAGSQWSVAAEPAASEQPQGAQLELAFRGATAVSGANLTDADALDAYGNPRSGPSPTFFQADPTWKSSIAALDGARYVQTRVTFVANAATNARPELSALGVAWR